MAGTLVEFFRRAGGATHESNFALVGGGIPVTLVGGAAVVDLEKIVDFAANPTNVSVLTPLISLRQADALVSYIAHAFCLLNLGSVAVTYDILMSYDGVHLDADADNVRSGISVPAGESFTLAIGNYPALSYFGLQAQSADHTEQPVKFAWVAVPR